MKVVDFPVDNSVADALAIAMDRAEHLEQVVILALDKEGFQHLISSRTSMQEKCFLHKFFGAYLDSEFFMEFSSD